MSKFIHSFFEAGNEDTPTFSPKKRAFDSMNSFKYKKEAAEVVKSSTMIKLSDYERTEECAKRKCSK